MSNGFSISDSGSLIKVVKLSASDDISFSALLTIFPQTKWKKKLTGKHYLYVGVEFYQMHLLHLFKWPHILSLLICYCSELLLWIFHYYTILAYLEVTQLGSEVLPFIHTVEINLLICLEFLHLYSWMKQTYNFLLCNVFVFTRVNVALLGWAGE